DRSAGPGCGPCRCRTMPHSRTAAGKAYHCPCVPYPYLLFIFHMGMRGAALATIGGQFLSAIWQLSFLFGKRTIISLNKDLLKMKIDYVIHIIKTGIPAFLMQISNSVLNIILNSTLVKYGGDVALSAIGIVTSIQTLILMPITGLMQGQQPLISYNYGAKQTNRVKETVKYAVIGATMISIIGFLAVQLFTQSIVYMFNDEKEVVALCVSALHIWFMLLPVDGCQIMCANYFQAVGKIKISSILNLLRQVIILIPLILILSSIFGLYGIFYAVPIADGLAFVITMVLFMKTIKMDT
ncbi:MAG: MATE family efflux transporter, partial [Faecalibacillus sp.]